MPWGKGRERQGKYPMRPWVAGAVIIQTKHRDKQQLEDTAAQERVKRPWDKKRLAQWRKRGRG